MSWNISTPIVAKYDFEVALLDLFLPDTQAEPWAIEQFAAAKRAALELAKTIPGPYISATFSGHANGIGWHKKEAYSNDFISMHVIQHVELSK